MNDQFSNQKNATGGTSGSTFRLNPSATEFVPKFATASKPQPTHNNNSNSNNRNNNNNNYRNQNNNYMGNQNDIDPIEMEARCEAVVEILQDERVREHLNPLMNGGDNNSGGGNNAHQESAAQAAAAHHQQQQDFNECDDEEEMFEMMAMQEECRMEMMKFYIQSQNPELFSEIYHDVSYPDQPMKLNPTGVPPPVVSGTGESSTSPSVSNSSTSETTDSSPNKSPKVQNATATNDKADSAAAAAENLNTNANTFVPNQLEQLNLNDDSTSKKD